MGTNEYQQITGIYTSLFIEYLNENVDALYIPYVVCFCQEAELEDLRKKYQVERYYVYSNSDPLKESFSNSSWFLNEYVETLPRLGLMGTLLVAMKTRGGLINDSYIKNQFIDSENIEIYKNDRVLISTFLESQFYSDAVDPLEEKEVDDQVRNFFLTRYPFIKDYCGDDLELVDKLIREFFANPEIAITEECVSALVSLYKNGTRVEKRSAIGKELEKEIELFKNTAEGDPLPSVVSPIELATSLNMDVFELVIEEIEMIDKLLPLLDSMPRMRKVLERMRQERTMILRNQK